MRKQSFNEDIHALHGFDLLLTVCLIKVLDAYYVFMLALKMYEMEC